MTSDQSYFLKWYQVEDFWIDNSSSIPDMAYNLQQRQKRNMAEESETDDDDDDGKRIQWNIKWYVLLLLA